MTENKRIVIVLFNLMILFYLFRTAIPFFKFPFMFLYCYFIIYTLISYRSEVFTTLGKLIRNYYLTFVLALILFLSFLLSNKLYLTIFTDVVNTAILISIFFILSLLISKKKEITVYFSNLIVLIVCFAFVISIFGLFDLLNFFPKNIFYNTFKGNGFSYDDPVSIDFNFALLPVFFGIISVCYFLTKQNSKLQSVLYNCLLLVFFLNIILSGSRRGLIILIGIFLILIISKISTMFRNAVILKKLSSNTLAPILSLISLFVLLNLFFFHTSYKFKNRTLKFLGTKEIVVARYEISKNLFKYAFVVNKNISFSDFNNKIWSLIFVPDDPDSGWGSRIHKTIFPLAGNNVEIVPSDAKGYLMDNTCNASYYPSINLCESYTFWAKLRVKKGDHYKASVYCFVSDDFNGNSVSFGNMISTIQEGIVYGNPHSYYNLNSKGIWKKLEIEFKCNDGISELLMSFTQNQVKDFSKLTGYVIFAYPHYEKVNEAGSDLDFNFNKFESPEGSTELPVIVSLDEYQKSKGLFNKLCQEKKTYLSSFGRFNSGLFSKMPSGSSMTGYYNSDIFPSSYLILHAKYISQNDEDPIRDRISKFISEDTTYYSPKAKLFINSNWNKYGDERIVRWIFALQIFSKEFTLQQKLFGGGFNFLNWYGYFFLKDKTMKDWPHNPFLSILLYSGIFGLIIYCYFLYKVFFYYIKYRKEYPLLFIFFLITFFFSFFSGGSPFDPPIMGFFVILPFFIHYIHKKDAGLKES